MRRLALLALLFAFPTRAAWTAAERRGVVEAAVAVKNEVFAGTATINNPSATRANIILSTGRPPAGAPCARCSIWLSRRQAARLNLDTAIDVGDKQYAWLQVCGPTSSATGPITPPDWLVDLVDTCLKTPVYTATSNWPNAIVLLRDDPAAQTSTDGFPCACRKNTSAAGQCEWCRPNAGSACTWVDAPLGMTLLEGEWRENTAAACLRKTCVELFGFNSLPDLCK